MSSEKVSQDVAVIGFDLDQTLYPKSPEIDEGIQAYLYECIALEHGCSVQEARALFVNLYRNGEGLSGGKAMEELGFSNGGELVQQALEQADIAPFLEPNPRHLRLLNRWREKYSLDVLTGSNRKNTLKKLGMLSIELDIFNHVITADDASKSTGEAFRQWLLLYPDLEPGNFLYVGDRFRTDHVIPREFGIKTAIINISKPRVEYDCLQLTSLDDLDFYV